MRRVFLVDFCCALAGSALYALFLDVMVGRLGLPGHVARAQLLANLSYALYGGVLLLARPGGLGFYRFLASMNALYASLCGLAALVLAVTTHAVWGSLVLLVEGLLIASLALWEKRALAGSSAESTQGVTVNP